MGDLDCGGCDCDCGDCLCCCDDGCGGGGDSCCCFFLGGGPSSGNRSNSYGSLRCWCCCLLTLLAVVALVLVLAIAVVQPVHVAVADASLARLALAGPNGTALAFNVSLAVAVDNRNWAMRAEPGTDSPFDAKLLFSGVPIAHVRVGSSVGIGPGMTAVYRTTASGESESLGSSVLAEFVKESAAGGVFRLELKLAGDVRYPPHRGVHRVNVTCPLELPLSSATPVARFAKVKCV